MRVECIIRTWERKATNIVIQIPSERKNLERLFLLLENAHHDVWEYRGTIRRGYIEKCIKINSKINAKALQNLLGKGSKADTSSTWWRRPHPIAINSPAIRNVGIDVIPHLPFKITCDTVWLPVVCISQAASQRIPFISWFVSINCKFVTRTHKHLHITLLSSYFLNSLVCKALQEQKTLYIASTNLCPMTNFLNVSTNIYIHHMVVYYYFVS
jgi:hypothetical protein